MGAGFGEAQQNDPSKVCFSCVGSGARLDGVGRIPVITAYYESLGKSSGHEI